MRDRVETVIYNFLEETATLRFPKQKQEIVQEEGKRLFLNSRFFLDAIFHVSARGPSIFS